MPIYTLNTYIALEVSGFIPGRDSIKKRNMISEAAFYWAHLASPVEYVFTLMWVVKSDGNN